MSDVGQAQTGVDRNLLIALLALQMNRVKVDALVEALNAWVPDKRQALGELLVERAQLQRHDLAMLDALVDRLLTCEGGVAAGIVEIVCNAGPVRLLSAAEREQAPTYRVPTDAAPALPPTAALPPAAADPAALRYRILRPHARGALGEVFVAHDEELGREVALKQLQEEHANSPTSRARFMQEAEITGGLEHPGIVPVYGLGTCPDGRPYYAMRFIKGDSLHDALRRFHDADPQRRDPGQRVLELRQLLERFVAVCNAVAYAHSRGVIHRDLKPANVMLGPYGQTLVVDWGLAKLIGQCEPTGAADQAEPSLCPESAGGVMPTQDGVVVGTPAYMSPEQAAGRQDDLGPASDVYSLGATLYAVLTGRAAFDGTTVSDIVERVQRGEFAPPHRVKAGVPRALEAVCLKAMALRPEDRYPSPQDLANDLERWLAGEPVTACREPARVRLGRWMRRHRTVMSSLAVLLLTAVAALSASVIMLSVEQGKTDEQRRQAILQKERGDAEAAALRAVNDFLQRDLLGQSDIRNQPAGERDHNVSVRALLDRAAARIERRFESQPTTEAAICQTLGNAYRALGEYDAAQQHLQRALALRRAHHGDDHADTLTSMSDMAELYLDRGRWDEAEPLLVQALAGRRGSVGDDHRDTLRSRHDLARLYRERGQADKAEALFREVFEARRDNLGVDDPDTLDSMSGLAVLYWELGRADDAELLLRQARALSEAKLGADHPDTLSVMNNLAALYRDRGRWADAETLYTETLQAQRRTLGDDHPDTLRSMNHLAVLYVHRGQFDDARTLMEQALAGQRKLGADHPDTFTSMHNLAWLHWERGQFEDAENRFKETIEGRRRKLGSTHRQTLESIGLLGEFYRAQGRLDEAEPLLHEALAGRRRLGEDHPDTLTSMHKLALLYQDRGRPDDAEALLTQVLRARRQKLGGEHPDTLGTTVSLGRLLQDRGRLDEAAELLGQALAGYRKLGPDAPATLAAMDALGNHYRQRRRLNDAEPLLTEALAGRRRVLGAAHRDTLISTSDMALLLQARGNHGKAEALLKEAIEGMRGSMDADDRATLSVQANLAALYWERDRLDEAEALYRVVLAGRRRKLGDTHRATVTTMYDLGELLWQRRQFKAAEPLLTAALAGRRRALGNDEPRTLYAMNNLAVVHQARGRCDEAQKLYQEALSGLRRMLGDDDDHTLMTMSNLADLYEARSKTALAEPLRREHAAALKKKDGADSSAYATALAIWTINLLEQRKYAEAERVARECLAVRTQLQSTSWTAFNARALLGAALLGQRKYAEAEPLLVSGYQGMKRREATIPPQVRFRLTETLERLVGLYEATQRMEQAARWRQELDTLRAGSSAPAT